METKYGGYMGKVLEVDLTTQAVSEYPWTDKDRELFIGGKTMADKILYDSFTGQEKPFSEENILVISTGPLTGTGAPSSGRYNIATLSPQTGIIGTSNCGGSFGYYLKKAGIDALVIKGKCAEHTWIEIDNGEFIFHNADEDGIWGLKVTEAQDKIRGILHEKWGFKRAFGQMVIGPAGENLVLYSAVISDERAAGRTGMGAVMGWKNLKGIAATGNHEFRIINPEKNTKWNQKWFKYLRNHPLTGNQLPRMGTAALVSQMQMRGILSTKNYTYGQYDEFDNVNGETLAEEYNIVNKGCLTCPIKCARTVNVEGREVKGPELETLGLLGGGILNNNMENILKWNNELDELGMDTISCASTIAYAMEANEEGLWDNGLKFGDTEGISQLFEDIAYRRGIGNEIADGSRKCAQKYGGLEFAIQSKGLELAAYEPRRAVGQGLGYAVSNRGGCHLNGGYLVILEGLGLYTDSQTPHAKADFTMLFQDLMEMISASGQCLFTSYAFFPGFLITKPNGVVTRIANAAIPFIGGVLRLINKCPTAVAMHLPVFHHTKAFIYAVGMKMNFGKYIRCGERGYTLERALDCRFGISSKDDTLPKRLTDVPQDPNDPKTKVPLDRMKVTYYKARGWDQNGVPTQKTLKKLKIIA
ncbi:MAG: aldehyde ferredoxin oxidoreductase family protein [Lachnospiraceae bacterium]|nr:aldehyde ferredoxin oxidoreductase family protein [Lachnospiraceae bacterium]